MTSSLGGFITLSSLCFTAVPPSPGLSYRRRRVCMNLKFWVVLSRSQHSVVLLYLHLQDLLQEEDSMYEPQVLEV